MNHITDEQLIALLDYFEQLVSTGAATEHEALAYRALLELVRRRRKAAA